LRFLTAKIAKGAKVDEGFGYRIVTTKGTKHTKVQKPEI